MQIPSTEICAFFLNQWSVWLISLNRNYRLKISFLRKCSTWNSLFTCLSTFTSVFKTCTPIRVEQEFSKKLKKLCFMSNGNSYISRDFTTISVASNIRMSISQYWNINTRCITCSFQKINDIKFIIQFNCTRLGITPNLKL